MKLKTILNESVTFFVDTGEARVSTDDVLSVAYHMQNIFFNHISKNARFYEKFILSDRARRPQFDADGNDAFESTGVVNLYPRESLSDPRFADDFKNALRHTLSEIKKFAEIGPLKVEGEKSGTNFEGPRSPYKKGDPVTKIGVIRIPILKNNSKPDTMPEFNISNQNAKLLIDALSIDDNGELAGQITVEEIPRLLMKIRNMSDKSMSRATREPEKSEDGPGAKIYDQGVDIDRVKGYLSRLTEILETALKLKKPVNFS